MQRSEAIRKMTDHYGVNERTATRKISESTGSQGHTAMVLHGVFIRAIPVDKPDHKWEFEFFGPRS